MGKINMKKDYETKDIKATKTKSEIWEDENGVFRFTINGETHGFSSKENAEIALKRLKG